MIRFKSLTGANYSEYNLSMSEVESAIKVWGGDSSDRLEVFLVNDDFFMKYIDPDHNEDKNCPLLNEDTIRKANAAETGKSRRKLLQDVCGQFCSYVCPSTEYLGVYYHSFNWGFLSSYDREYYQAPCGERKTIFICTERIKHLACAKNYAHRNLFEKVLIHELAHAYMDVYNDSGYARGNDYYWMEESFANVMTLIAIENYCVTSQRYKDKFKEAKDFISKQPDAYKFGLKMFEAGILNYNLWTYNKNDISIFFDWISEAKSGICNIGTWNKVRDKILK